MKNREKRKNKPGEAGECEDWILILLPGQAGLGSPGKLLREVLNCLKINVKTANIKMKNNKSLAHSLIGRTLSEIKRRISKRDCEKVLSGFVFVIWGWQYDNVQFPSQCI